MPHAIKNFETEYLFSSGKEAKTEQTEVILDKSEEGITLEINNYSKNNSRKILRLKRIRPDYLLSIEKVISKWFTFDSDPNISKRIGNLDGQLKTNGEEERVTGIDFAVGERYLSFLIDTAEADIADEVAIPVASTVKDHSPQDTEILEEFWNLLRDFFDLIEIEDMKSSSTDSTPAPEQEETRSGQFLDIENISDPFYDDLVQEINTCYKHHANESVRILYRKLLENLLIDILRGYYGPEQVELYYNTETGQHHPLSKLIDNFDEHKQDLRHLSDAIDSDLIDKINEFRRHGNASAHSIEKRVTDEEIESESESATYVSNILFRIWRNVLSHSSESEFGREEGDLANSDSVVFVEGRSDKVILERFAETLGWSFEKNNVEPIVVGGSEVVAYSDSVINVLRQLGIPYVFVFDSDGEDPQEKEKEVADKIGVSPEDVYVLQEYSIESYLIQTPEMIAKDIGEDTETVENYLEEHKNVDNKKGVLDDLYKEYIGTGYHPEKNGATIAKRVNRDQIPNEIKTLVREVSKL